MSLAELRAEWPLGTKFAPGGVVLTLTVPKTLEIVQEVPAGREDMFEAIKARFATEARRVMRRSGDQRSLRVDVEIEGAESCRGLGGRDTDEEED